MSPFWSSSLKHQIFPAITLAVVLLTVCPIKSRPRTLQSPNCKLAPGTGPARCAGQPPSPPLPHLRKNLILTQSNIGQDSNDASAANFRKFLAQRHGARWCWYDKDPKTGVVRGIGNFCAPLEWKISDIGRFQLGFTPENLRYWLGISGSNGHFTLLCPEGTANIGVRGHNARSEGYMRDLQWECRSSVLAQNSEMWLTSADVASDPAGAFGPLQCADGPSVGVAIEHGSLPEDGFEQMALVCTEVPMTAAQRNNSQSACVDYPQVSSSETNVQDIKIEGGCARKPGPR